MRMSVSWLTLWPQLPVSCLFLLPVSGFVFTLLSYVCPWWWEGRGGRGWGGLRLLSTAVEETNVLYRKERGRETEDWCDLGTRTTKHNSTHSLTMTGRFCQTLHHNNCWSVLQQIYSFFRLYQEVSLMGFSQESTSIMWRQVHIFSYECLWRSHGVRPVLFLWS